MAEDGLLERRYEKWRHSLHFDVNNLITRARRIGSKQIGEATLHLPFVSVAVSPQDREKAAAGEVAIRTRDRRVLSGRECFDNCIDASVESLQEIRALMVDQQVALSDLRDGPLLMLTDIIRQGLRQFLTYEKHLRRAPDDDTPGLLADVRWNAAVREAYFAGLEQLRGHISRSLHEVRKIGGMPEGEKALDYATPWPLEQYVTPQRAEQERLRSCATRSTRPL